MQSTIAFAPFANAAGRPLFRNVMGLTFATNENSYMIGCLAAQMARRDGSNTISAVGGIKIPTVDIFIAAYRAGAQECVVIADLTPARLERSLRQAVERHRVQQQLADLALRDDLTGLYNRRGILAERRGQWAAARTVSPQRGKQPPQLTVPDDGAAVSGRRREL